MDNVDSSMRALILKVRSRLKLRTRICALTFPLLYQLHFFRQRWAILRLKDKVRRGGKIRVAFLSMYATSNQDVGVFDLMLKDNAFFDPYIIVNPDVARSYENARFNYDRTRKIFVAKYGRERVLDGVSETGEFIDYSRMFDLMTTSNPYDDMAGGTFKVKYWAGRNVPVFYTSYFYMGRCLPTIFNLKMQNFSLFWKFYAENEFVIQLARKYQFCRGANCVLVGSPKLDNYHRIVPNRHDRKLVLVCPHHSVGDVFPRGGGSLNMQIR